MKRFIVLLCSLAAAGLGAPAGAALDLDRVSVSRLDNGLTLLVLEERSAPVVSVQMLYKVGGRDDPQGKMGLAHFFEHMAFRSSKNFPDTGLVSEIYAAGGEWHGYTWIDQTTYFATAPKENLDLLLRIEADRMNNLDIAADVVYAEAGAVLSEMNGYANDPSSVLFDAVAATAFQVHPYGKNTIGYGGDVRNITHTDLVAFYRQHIRPNNAVLAVVGDVDTGEVRRRVAAYFGEAKAGAPASLPPQSEPAFAAERRIRIEGDDDRRLYKIAYPAPAASSSDFPAFLVLQELLAGGSGVNFHQNEWGTPARSGSPLDKAVHGVTTWTIASAEPYLFVISGEAGPKSKESKIKGAIERALDKAARQPADQTALEKARSAVIRELILDVETTEDAAHELAFFEGVGALEQRLQLDEKVSAVTAGDVMRVAETYLNPARRTIGWYAPTDARPPQLPAPPASLAQAAVRRGAPVSAAASPPSRIAMLAGGARIIYQRSPLSPTVSVKLVAPGRYACEECTVDDPLAGYTSLIVSGEAGELPSLIERARRAISSAKRTGNIEPSSADPATLLEEIFAARFAAEGAHETAALSLIVISGDVNGEEAASLAGETFPAAGAAGVPEVTLTPGRGDIDISLSQKKAQAALGYMVAAPALSDESAIAWRIALYILSHDYEGRLGKEAISRRGLVYYIGADYRAAPEAGLITLSIGVDPDKQEAMRALLKSELARALNEPPTGEELAEAKRHLIGRRISEAQSNPEIAAALAREWLTQGALRDGADYASAVNAVSLEAVRALLPAFAGGDIVTIKVGE